MVDSISRTKAINVVYRKYPYNAEQNKCDEIIDALKALPSTNRPTGEWINKGDYAECSICGAHSGMQFDGVELVPLKTKFCHHCGAEMKIPLYVYASWDRSEE